MGVAWRLARRAGGLALVVLAVTMAAVLHFSSRNLELHAASRGLAQPVDAVIVLGAGLDKEGDIGHSSRLRVDGAVSLLANGLTRRLILSGGPLPGTTQPMISEVMRDYAIRQGAPPEALIVENRSTTTFENLRFSFALAEENGLDDLAVLTESYHLQRARWLATYFGRPEIVPVAVPNLASSDLSIQAQLVGRETLAWWYNLGKVAAWEAFAAFGVDVATRESWVR